MKLIELTMLIKFIELMKESGLADLIPVLSKLHLPGTGLCQLNQPLNQSTNQLIYLEGKF